MKGLLQIHDPLKPKGHAVGIDLAFYVIGQVLSYPFVTLAKPAIIVDLTPFLPNMGVVGNLP